MSKPVCDWPLDENGLVPLSEMVEPAGGCVFPAGFRGWVLAARIVDENGHTLDGDFDPKGKDGCAHRETTEWKKAHRKKVKERKMEHVKEEVPVMLADNSHATPLLASTVSEPAPFDIQKLVDSGGANGMTVVLAVVGVAGGGAALKFYQSWQKSRHEENMKRLEIEEKRADKQEDSHQKCSVERMVLESKIVALESKLETVSQKASLSFGSDFDPEDLEKRLKKLEKATKVAAKKKEK